MRLTTLAGARREKLRGWARLARRCGKRPTRGNRFGKLFNVSDAERPGKSCSTKPAPGESDDGKVTVGVNPTVAIPKALRPASQIP